MPVGGWWGDAATHSGGLHQRTAHLLVSMVALTRAENGQGLWPPPIPTLQLGLRDLRDRKLRGALRGTTLEKGKLCPAWVTGRGGSQLGALVVLSHYVSLHLHRLRHCHHLDNSCQYSGMTQTCRAPPARHLYPRAELGGSAVGERAWLPWNAGFLGSEKRVKHVAAPTANVKSRSQRQVKTGSTTTLVFSCQWKHQVGGTHTQTCTLQLRSHWPCAACEMLVSETSTWWGVQVLRAFSV